ncbi:MAG: hypothetical protein UY77_C0009G0002 [Candidatus Uhrbacteria bacterium GW2011_GWA2_53_10]|uniref:DUF262 domain-containing protein n=1 Tax=Candidatus Uhrbacteria bacterium GW2011_GWA2_53_10 TaxID=1618980 RepID=A0A0G2AJZ5_9BACT|nr:MAG: hypothetical protein UY77_C0009G0002 [Candidatus Uhrbacteria bacterium GW2011_GWA2_53_10]
MARESVKVLHGALDEIGKGDERKVVLRGVIDHDSLGLLQVDDYQREVLTGSSYDGLVKAFQAGQSVQDIVLGMRGQNFNEREGVFYLKDEVFIVDGLQRVSAAKSVVSGPAEGNAPKPRIGATIHFDTSHKWERGQFLILNADRVKVSANVLARNLREDHAAVSILYNLSTGMGERSFALHNRVCWTQRMTRQDLITATTFLKVIGWLHSHLGPGRSNRIPELAAALDTTVERVGKNTYRDNVRTFFDIVDACWGVRQVAYASTAVQLRLSFLLSLARMFSTNHTLFFRDKRLVVDADTKRKLARFPIRDPNVINLAGSGGMNGIMLYMLIVKHVNRGRRTHRLIEEELPEVEEATEESEVAAAANGD